jgi:hypothetical protein
MTALLSFLKRLDEQVVLAVLRNSNYVIHDQGLQGRRPMVFQAYSEYISTAVRQLDGRLDIKRTFGFQIFNDEQVGFFNLPDVKSSSQNDNNQQNANAHDDLDGLGHDFLIPQWFFMISLILYWAGFLYNTQLNYSKDYQGSYPKTVTTSL